MHFIAPPAILQDFDKFLDILGQSSPIELTNGKGELRNADLVRLNDAMHFRLGIVNPRSKQPSFPLLNTFFHIARTAEFFRVKKDSVAQQCAFTVNPTRIREYDLLNHDEQYFFLLETFWCFLDWREAFDNHWFPGESFYKEMLKQPVGIPVTIGDKDAKRPGKINGPSDTVTVEVFQAFGFFDLVWDEKLEKRPNRYIFPYQSATLTQLGKTMLPILLAERPAHVWGGQDPYLTPDNEGQEDKDDFSPLPSFRSLLMAEDQSEGIEQPSETTFDTAFHVVLPHLEVEKRLFPIVIMPLPGAYTFRISLKKTCYREISISGEKTFEDLHMAIQDLFEFHNDHLYAFYLNGNRYPINVRQVYADPRGGNMNYEKLANLFKISEVGLFPGQEICYLFDFGDNWKFAVVLLDIQPDVEVSGKYKVLKKVGKSPEQYARW